MLKRNVRKVEFFLVIDEKKIMFEVPYTEIVKKVRKAVELKKDSIMLSVPGTDRTIEVELENAKDIIAQVDRMYKMCRNEEKRETISLILEVHLNKYITDITGKYRNKKCKKLVGRNEEINHIWTYLAGKEKTNVILIGEDGVGKKSICYEIARRIACNECPKEFADFKVYKLEMQKILEIDSNVKIQMLFNSLNVLFTMNKKIILFIEDLLYTRADYDLIMFFNTIIVNNSIKVLGNINVDDFNTYFADDKTRRYFNEIEIEEPNIPELLKMVNSKVKKLQEEYDVLIPEKIAKFAVYTSYYLSNSNSSNPESTLDTIKYALVKAKMNGQKELDKKCILDHYDINVKLVNKMTYDEKKVTAYHEVGHYIVHRKANKMKDNVENAFVSILPIGSALGLNADFYPQEQTTCDREYYIDHIAWLLGGRIAEKEYTNVYSSGASSDLANATALAEQVILIFGMSKKTSKNRSYTNGRYIKTELLPEGLKEEINNEINEILNEAYEVAENIIKENLKLVELIVEELLKDEILTGEEIEEICTKNS